jgi:hypothetical protein
MSSIIGQFRQTPQVPGEREVLVYQCPFARREVESTREALRLLRHHLPKDH